MRACVTASSEVPTFARYCSMATRERVTSLRSHHKIPVHRFADDGIEPWLNLTRAAAYLGVSTTMLALLLTLAIRQFTHRLQP